MNWWINSDTTFSKKQSDTVFNLIAQYGIKSAEQIGFLHATRKYPSNNIVLMNT